MLQISLVLTEFTKTLSKEIIHVQCTIHNATTPSYKLTGITKCWQTIKMAEYVWLTFGPPVYLKMCYW